MGISLPALILLGIRLHWPHVKMRDRTLNFSTGIPLLSLFMYKFVSLLCFLLLSSLSMAATLNDHYFTNREGLRLHYLSAGTGQQTIVFVPGWLMPAAVFRLQLEALGDEFRVLAFDPRSQGKSDIFQGSHDTARRMDDMEDFLVAAEVTEFVFAGWSLGVLETLDFIERKPQSGLRGLILIDNSIGEGTPGSARSGKFFTEMKDPDRRKKYLSNFSSGIFTAQSPDDISAAALSSALQVPGPAAIQLISQPYPRTYWRDIVAKQTVPVLYAITPRFREQGVALLRRKGKLAQVEVFNGVGHALFVDDPERFNSMTSVFVKRSFTSARVTPSDLISGQVVIDGQSASSATQTFSGS
jgi:microsomal epoxide hydrolase